MRYRFLTAFFALFASKNIAASRPNVGHIHTTFSNGVLKKENNLRPQKCFSSVSPLIADYINTHTHG